MMKRIAVIGLGRFGSRLAANLAFAGQDVIAIDRDLKLVDQIRDEVTLAISLDVTDEQALRAHGIDKVDIAVVGIGSNFESTCLATVILKQMGVPRVISRAVTPTSARILDKIGADEVVNPEDESADRWAHSLVMPKFLKQFIVEPGFSVVEIEMPEAWVGKNLMSLGLRQKSQLNVIAIKQLNVKGDKSKGASLIVPDPTKPLTSEQSLLLLGSDADLAEIAQ